MSDPSLTAACLDCKWWMHGTSALTWTGEHLDIEPEHRVVISKSGDLPR